MSDFASIDTQISATGPGVCELRPLEFDFRRDFDLKIISDAWKGARERVGGGVVAATAHNKLSSLLYPMI
jgi:hypothetical protein